MDPLPVWQVVLPAERALLTTQKVDSALRRLRLWNWTSVLRKVIVLCTLYMVCLVGVTKVTTLFFSWLSQELARMSLVASTAIFVAVGMCMFLLPPVPGNAMHSSRAPLWGPQEPMGPHTTRWDPIW